MEISRKPLFPLLLMIFSFSTFSQYVEVNEYMSARCGKHFKIGSKVVHLSSVDTIESISVPSKAPKKRKYRLKKLGAKYTNPTAYFYQVGWNDLCIYKETDKIVTWDRTEEVGPKNETVSIRTTRWKVGDVFLWLASAARTVSGPFRIEKMLESGEVIAKPSIDYDPSLSNLYEDFQDFSYDARAPMHYVSVPKYNEFEVGSCVIMNSDSRPKIHIIEDILKEGFLLTDRWSSETYWHYSKFRLVKCPEGKIKSKIPSIKVHRVQKT